MKKKINIICGISIFCIILGIVFSFYPLDKVPYDGVEYYIPLNSYCSCLTFYDDNSFSEYDCESEPSVVPFSGEYYNKYFYSKRNKTIVFKGTEKKDVKVSILEWTDDKLKIKVLNSKSDDTNCSINGKNVYEYYRDSKIYTGKELLEYINGFDLNKFKLSLYDKNDYYKNYKDEDCSSCFFVSSNEILNKIKEKKEYKVSYMRKENGTVTGVYFHLNESK